jgi:hypothetical protein
MYFGCRLGRLIKGSVAGTRFLSLYSFFLDSPYARVILPFALWMNCGRSDAIRESTFGMLRYREGDWRRI